MTKENAVPVIDAIVDLGTRFETCSVRFRRPIGIGRDETSQPVQVLKIKATRQLPDPQSGSLG
jgi:hypothetical protein